MISVHDLYRYFAVRFWRAWGRPGEAASELEHWIVFVMAKSEDGAIDECWRMAEAHDRLFADGTAVTTESFDGPMDTHIVDASELLEDEEFGPYEIFWDTFAATGDPISSDEPRLRVDAAGTVVGNSPSPEPAAAEPRFFSVKLWKTWSRLTEQPHMYEASYLLLSASSCDDAARKVTGWAIQEQEGEHALYFHDDDSVSEIRFHSIGHIYDTGTDFLFDLLDGSRPMYAERMRVGAWGPPPVGFSPLATRLEP